MKNSKNKSKGWFKSVLTAQPQLDKDNSTGEGTVSSEIFEEPDSIEDITSQKGPLHNKHLFQKENQDKLSLDVIVSVENLLNARQLLLHNNRDLENRITEANETINRLKLDIQKQDQLLVDKSKEISILENNLTNKQMSYDQLLEDYKNYQYTSKNDFEKVSSQLEKEINKYNKLNEVSKNNQYESMVKIKDLEEKVRNFEVENQKLEEHCQQILDEKNELMRTINDFTERMALSFSPKPPTSTQLE